MKRIHPNACHAAALAALAATFGVTGCRNQSGAAVNPFLAPNRVPPPATRALAPGEARPYYPGDPLPVMQSGTTTQTTTSDGLAWTSPGGTSPIVNEARPQPLHFANDSMVAIPADSDALRFALPAPDEPEPPAPVAHVAVSPPAGVQGVVQASYTEPVMATAAPAPVSPWRSPQLAQSQTFAPAAPAYFPVAYPQFAAAPNPNATNVQLGVAASTPPEPGQFGWPRIRLPGYVGAPQTASANDGFRPRSSMR